MNAILQNLGWDSFFESQLAGLQVRIDSIARVTAEHKGIYHIKNPQGDYLARVTGKHVFAAMNREDYPAVGDWVVFDKTQDNQAVITQILLRKTIIRKTVALRKSPDKIKSQIIAVNVDVAFVVESVDRDYSLNRLERYFAIAMNAGVEPAIILNKIDLISADDLESRVTELKARFKDRTIATTSTTAESGLDNLKNSIKPGKTYCFLGSSGVGKSSLINALIGERVVRTGEISQCNERGKHVTTHREMFLLDNGGVVIDNPGMREVGLADSEIGLNATFDEISDLAAKCKFADCSHLHESGCAVREAVKDGVFDKERYDNYIQMKKESEHYDMTDYEKRGKDKKFGQSVKNYHKRMKEFE